MTNEKSQIESAEHRDEIEVITTPSDLTTQEPITQDGMDAVIAVAAKMGAYEKAMDTIINAIIKRSFAGDWVCHAREKDKLEDRKANIGSAAAERIAAFLGIQERNWSHGIKIMSDDGKSFTWQFEAEFGFGRRWIHVIGRASSKDKFFGYAYGQWKPLEDVKEDDVRMAAHRATRKEGVRALLGLRAIPISKLQELGYDTGKVRYANFEEKGAALKTDEKSVDAKTGMAKRKITLKTITPNPWSKPEEKDKMGKVIKKARSGYRTEAFDEQNVKWLLWHDDPTSMRYLALCDALELHQEVEVEFQVKKTDKGEQYEIIKVNGAVDA